MQSLRLEMDQCLGCAHTVTDQQTIRLGLIGKPSRLNQWEAKCRVTGSRELAAYYREGAT